PPQSTPRPGDSMRSDAAAAAQALARMRQRMRSRWTTVLLAVLLPSAPAVANPNSRAECGKSELLKVQKTVFWSTSSSVPAFFYTAGLAIDADGAFRAYNPHDVLGLDSLAHAGHPGNWWALVTDNGRPSGHPVVQGNSDPAPGFYVSATALYDPRRH